jgi:hypothetical protein
MNANTLFLIAAAAVFSVLQSCSNTENQGDTTPPVDSVTVVEPRIVTDGETVYTEENLDSLRYTYDYEFENGLYFVVKNSQSTMGVMPVEPWEKVFVRPADFAKDTQAQFSCAKVHRTRGIKIFTSGRPIEVTGSGKNQTVFIPFDGNTASAFTDFQTKYPDATVALIAGEQTVEFFTNYAGISVAGISLTGLNKIQVEFLQKAFSLTKVEEVDA